MDPVSNISPLRYPGGKTRACKIIDNVLQEHFDIGLFDTLVSPFVGGGSFEFYFQNKYNVKLVVNDKFTPLYNFWNQVKVNKSELCAELRKIKTVSKTDFINYRNDIMDNANPFTQSVQYFVINRCSFSGATLSGGFSSEASKKRYTSSSIDKIEKLNLDNIEIYNLDFTEFIERHCRGKCLLFIDPPYYLDSKLYGKNGDMHEHFDHQALYNVLQTKENWIITYNNCEYVKTLYNKYVILEVNWSYSMNKTKKSSEIIILSKLR